MGDRVGIFVLFGVIVILVVGFIMVEPRRARRGGDSMDSLNSHRDQTEQARRDHPEGAERSHLVGNPPVDTITPGRLGCGAAGRGRRARGAARGRPPRAPRGPHAPTPPLARPGGPVPGAAPSRRGWAPVAVLASTRPMKRDAGTLAPWRRRTGPATTPIGLASNGCAPSSTSRRSSRRRRRCVPSAPATPSPTSPTSPPTAASSSRSRTCRRMSMSTPRAARPA